MKASMLLGAFWGPSVYTGLNALQKMLFQTISSTESEFLGSWMFDWCGKLGIETPLKEEGCELLCNTFSSPLLSWASV